MKLRTSAPSSIGSASSHSAVASAVNCARASHTSQQPTMPEAYSSHMSGTPETQRKARARRKWPMAHSRNRCAKLTTTKPSAA